MYIAKSKGDNTGTDVIYKVTPATDAAGRPNLGVVGSTTTFVSGLQLPLSMTFLQQPLGAAYPQTYSNQLPFRETGASAWGTGASSITASYFLGPTWDTGGTVSKGVSADILFLGTFGAQVSANTQGKAGLNFSATASAGSVNINYPVQVTMGLWRPQLPFRRGLGFRADFVSGEWRRQSGNAGPKFHRPPGRGDERLFPCRRQGGSVQRHVH